jgi:hypothetical protein
MKKKPRLGNSSIVAVIVSCSCNNTMRVFRGRECNGSKKIILNNR